MISRWFSRHLPRDAIARARRPVALTGLILAFAVAAGTQAPTAHAGWFGDVYNGTSGTIYIAKFGPAYSSSCGIWNVNAGPKWAQATFKCSSRALYAGSWDPGGYDADGFTVPGSYYVHFYGGGAIRAGTPSAYLWTKIGDFEAARCYRQNGSVHCYVVSDFG